ncbi:bis(5'-adenosyl)-triphosphatase enpp4-like [Stylophora pistillata]|uniref:bis(5'-adenosyl)-triphosphatase enpp4-like n=1 Tax=Stylophora pistillata TaxID=50429 RepID=UPI000C047A4F|nr:bis(5'-adenosyl)-triphosphatase enpp4-like [Stylophora pistillata]
MVFLKIFFFISCFHWFNCVYSMRKDTVILVSFDGFRWDYLDMHRTATKNFSSIMKQGVRAEYVRNVFPTVTFPNHYTIVTGLYPESHGIISNSFYDAIANKSFDMNTNCSEWWDKFAEPLWVTSEKQGEKSGMCFWPGYDVVYKGQKPSFTPSEFGFGRPFAARENETIPPWKWRVDLVLKWLKDPDPPSFVTLYFEEPDEAGHCCGPDSVNVTEEIGRDDEITGYLLQELRKSNLTDSVNLIITADHGTAMYNLSTVLDFHEYLPPDYSLWIAGGAYFSFDATNLTGAYDRLKKAEKHNSHFSVYRKEELPEELHFKHSRFVAEINVILEEGWLAALEPYNHSLKVVTKGTHGWCPSTPSMHPFFLAQGPAFKQGYKSGPIEMVDIYPLICHLLGIDPLPNNGSLSRIEHLLKVAPNSSHSNAHWLTTGEIVAIVIGSAIALTVCMYAILMIQRDRRRHMIRSNRSGEGNQPLLFGDEDDENII